MAIFEAATRLRRRLPLDHFIEEAGAGYPGLARKAGRIGGMRSGYEGMRHCRKFLKAGMARP
jgi:hypothetical protein